MAQAPEPPGFDEEVRTPSLRSIYEKCGKPVPDDLRRNHGKPFTKQADAPEALTGTQLKDYWRNALPNLLNAYDRICAFCCFRIHPTASPSVDHMVPKSRRWDLVYEWSNYRLAALRMNSRKGALLTLIDPFEVEPGWFALELTFGQVVPGPACETNPELRRRVQDTIDLLGLDDFADERLRDIEDYESGEVGLQRLRIESPFVATELERQDRLRPATPAS